MTSRSVRHNKKNRAHSIQRRTLHHRRRNGHIGQRQSLAWSYGFDHPTPEYQETCADHEGDRDIESGGEGVVWETEVDRCFGPEVGVGARALEELQDAHG